MLRLKYLDNSHKDFIIYLSTRNCCFSFGFSQLFLVELFYCSFDYSQQTRFKIASKILLPVLLFDLLMSFQPTFLVLLEIFFCWLFRHERKINKYKSIKTETAQLEM